MHVRPHVQHSLLSDPTPRKARLEAEKAKAEEEEEKARIETELQEAAWAAEKAWEDRVAREKEAARLEHEKADTEARLAEEREAARIVTEKVEEERVARENEALRIEAETEKAEKARLNAEQEVALKAADCWPPRTSRHKPKSTKLCQRNHNPGQKQ